MRRVKILMKDPMIFGSRCETGSSDEDETESPLPQVEEPDIFSVNNDQQVTLDEKWVSGITVENGILASLSNTDRELLVRKYLVNQSAKEIMADMGYSSEQVVWNAVSRALRRIRELTLSDEGIKND